jgi:hypothetical protein
MARHRTRVRLARSLRAVGFAALASALATALFEWDLGRELALPLELIAAAPPIVYLALALVVMRDAPAGRWLSWALAACGVNAAIGVGTSVALAFAHPLSFEGALMRAFGLYVPAPLIHLVAAPCVLLAFRSRVAPSRPGLRARAAGPPPWVPASPVPAPASYDDVLRRSPHLPWATAPGGVAFERARPRDVEPAPASAVASEPAEAPAVVPPPVAAAPPTLDLAAPVVAMPLELVTPPPTPGRPARDASGVPERETAPPAPEEPVVRVPFDRLTGQLPPDVFVLPPARLSQSLREPHTLVIPQRLVIPQLGEGRVEVPWTLVEDQFPELGLAMPRTEVRRRFPEWVLSLPMDEVVRQVPAGLFHVAAPAADLSDIGQFPPPFNPGPPAPEPARSPEPAPLEDAATAPEPLPPAPVALAPSPAPAPAAVTPSPAVPPPAVAAPSRTPPPAPPAVAPAPVTPRTPAITVPGPAPAPVTVATGEVADEQLTALARALAMSLAPIGALEWRARRLAGRPLVSLVAAALAREAVDALAAHGATLLERLAPSGVDQITVRTSRVACVLTPLTVGGAFAAAVRRGGPVALLEILAARVRGAGRSPATPVVPAAVTPTTAVGEPNGRIGEAARALAVLGPTVPVEIAAEAGAPGVFLFASHADAALVAAARAVHEAVVAGHDDGALGRLESVTLRRGRERVVVRPLRGAGGGAALLAAAGEVTLAGRVHRSAARAGTLLEAH